LAVELEVEMVLMEAVEAPEEVVEEMQPEVQEVLGKEITEHLMLP
jgi:hypothetical protein